MKPRKRTRKNEAPETREKRLAYQKAYRQANASKAKAAAKEWREANPGRSAKLSADWRKANPAKALANSALSRCKKACPPWANRQAMVEVYALALEFRAAGIDVEVDHDIPINHPRVCGLHVAHNLRIRMTEANASKGNSWPWVRDNTYQFSD